MSLRIVDLIAAKRDGQELSAEALQQVISGYTAKDVPDYQMSAFLMAGYLRGFSHAETVAMTDAMIASGDRLDLSALAGPTVDKHSTGGVGDSTTLVVAPLAAALGMQIVKLSGRGLGFTGGTLDKMESIPGMRTGLTEKELLDQVARIGLVVCAQTSDLVPADKAIYALRDVTATVGNTALIASSIMSKKIAGGAQAILLDVKVGSGAFMKTVDAARELAEVCVALGGAAGRATRALITDMNQPLADTVGNAIDVREAIEVLRGEHPSRFVELCLELVAQLAVVAGVAPDVKSGREQAETALRSGAGLERFRMLIEAQGGDPRVVDDLSLLPSAPVVLDVQVPHDGWLETVDAEAVGRASGALGAGGNHCRTTSIPPSDWSSRSRSATESARETRWGGFSPTPMTTLTKARGRYWTRWLGLRPPYQRPRSSTRWSATTDGAVRFDGPIPTPAPQAGELAAGDRSPL